MDRDVVVKKLETIICEETDKTFLLTEDHVLIGTIGENQLGLSSIEFVKIILRLESEFHVAIDFDVKLNTVKDVLDYIEDASSDRARII